ncbi:MAG: YcnI family protein [Rhodocyclaceae bacterium]|nr:YcnI family protein [Rhodocyclaceae bacterium]
MLHAVLFGAAWLLAVPSASAHVVLAQKSAPAGSYHRAQFMVGHGCKGSPTVSVQVDIPDGVPVVRPQPKAGWALSYESGPLAEPAMVHGKPKTEGIRRVTWTGGPLPDEQFDEFGMMLFLAKPGRLQFRVLQTCEQGANDWGGGTAGGQPDPGLPAATLEVLDPSAHGMGEHSSHSHGHHHQQPEVSGGPSASGEPPVQPHEHRDH